MFVAAVASSICPSVSLAGDVLKIATSRVTANGCHEETKGFKTSIPNPEKLDRSYKGILAGIEVHEIAANHGHRFQNFAFADGNTAITYELYAKGAGTWIKNPFNNGGVCSGAAGGSEGIEVLAHYQ